MRLIEGMGLLAVGCHLLVHVLHFTQLDNYTQCGCMKYSVEYALLEHVFLRNNAHSNGTNNKISKSFQKGNL